MNKLIKYIDFRISKYGGIVGISSKSSMYYQIGHFKVRISDHMKYSNDILNQNDYYFIIQPNDTYIFMPAPKYNEDNKLYMKTITYQEAKDFIKKLHDCSLRYLGLSDWFKPSGWNGIKDSTENKPTNKTYSWEDFYNEFMLNEPEQKQFSIINKIETVVFGQIRKGNFSNKIKTIESIYNGMTNVQYNTLMQKM